MYQCDKCQCKCERVYSSIDAWLCEFCEMKEREKEEEFSTEFFAEYEE